MQIYYAVYVELDGCLIPNLGRKVRHGFVLLGPLPLRALAMDSLLFLRKFDYLHSMDELKQVQASAIKTGSLQTPPVLAKLVSFCALSPRGDAAYARSLLSSADHPSSAMYNAVLRGISAGKRSSVSASVSLYLEMLENGLQPDTYTFPFLLKVLADSRSLSNGQALHVHAIKLGFVDNVYVRNNLLRLYALCGQIGSAQRLFDRFLERDLVSWTILISAYAKLGYLKEALQVFEEMTDRNIRIDEVTMVAALSACSELGDLQLGRKLNIYIDTHKINVDVFVGNALVDMYSSCGDVNLAYKYFKKMPIKNIISWNSMISGFIHNGEFKQALALFHQLQEQGIDPDNITLVSMLTVCANLGALDLGKWVHTYIKRHGIEADGIVGNSLVDMYAKCGDIYCAFEIFCRMTRHDVHTYTSIIVGLAMHGLGEKALEVFADMVRVGVKPNVVTFVGVLTACVHAGLVATGLHHFKNMSQLYGVTPRIEHYGCMVDMFGRAGLLDEAHKLIASMPIEPDMYIWGSLLGACRIHGDTALGEISAKHLLDLEPKDEGTYVLMSNIYSSSNRGRDAIRTRKAMSMNNIKKTPGCSLIEVDGLVHEFQRGEE